LFDLIKQNRFSKIYLKVEKKKKMLKFKKFLKAKTFFPKVNNFRFTSTTQPKKSSKLGFFLMATLSFGVVAKVGIE
jgi:hypothetical protein